MGHADAGHLPARTGLHDREAMVQFHLPASHIVRTRDQGITEKHKNIFFWGNAEKRKVQGKD